MKVKCIHVCYTCQESFNETVELWDELKFKQRCEEKPEDYTIEEGPGYDGIYINHNRECSRCH